MGHNIPITWIIWLAFEYKRIYIVCYQCKYTIMDNILPTSLLGHKDVMALIADRFKRLRLDHFNWSRELLGSKSGVNASTIKRFEKTGQITIENLLLLAMAMDAVDEFTRLFPFPKLTSIRELEKQSHRRQRGRSN